MQIITFRKGDKVKINLLGNIILNNNIGVIVKIHKDRSILPIAVSLDIMGITEDFYFGYHELEQCK